MFVQPEENAHFASENENHQRTDDKEGRRRECKEESGLDIANSLSKRYPALKIVLMTGSALHAPHTFHSIPKPFNLQQLRTKLLQLKVI